MTALGFLALAIGHFAFCVWVINVSHSVGLDERKMNRLALAIIATLGLASLALLALAGFVPLDDWPIAARWYRGFCVALATVGVPLSILLRALQRNAEPFTKVEIDATSDLASPLGRDRLIGNSSRAWMLRLPGNESLRIRELSLELTVRSLPESLDGLTILHLSDTHLSTIYNPRYFEEVVARAARLGPFDLIAFTGDLIDDEEALHWVKPIFEPLRGRLGQFAILGNHDVPHRPGRVRKALRSAGFTIIDGRWNLLTLPESRATIAIGGTSSPWGPALRAELRPSADLSIVLSHTPDLLPRKASWGVDLVLAGHNHGGQVRLPWLGPILMPSRYSRRYDRGVFVRGRTLMHVSAGIGGKHPIRYGCPPEIARIRLRSDRVQAGAKA